MPYTARRRYPFAIQRKRRRKTMWVRDQMNLINPVSPVAFDLFSTWRTFMGFSVNLPDITIWRLRIRISITGKISVANSVKASNGVSIGCWVDSKNQSLTTVTSAPNEQHYLIYDQIPCAEAFMQSTNNFNSLAANEIYLFKDYDIKAHRKMPNVDDTLWFQVVQTGDYVLDQINFTERMLILLP